MTHGSAAWRYGWRLGLVAAGFAALQVLIMVGAGEAAGTAIATMQFSIANITFPGSAIVPLLVMLLATYLSMALTGIAMLWLAAHAGRLAASVSTRQGAGRSAGFWVALVSGAIWIALSLLVVGLTHTDGTLTGIITAHPTGPLRAAELIGLAIQEGFLALLGLGFGALAGARGAAGAMQRFMPPPPPPPAFWYGGQQAQWGGSPPLGWGMGVPYPPPYPPTTTFGSPPAALPGNAPGNPQLPPPQASSQAQPQTPPQSPTPEQPERAKNTEPAR